MILVEKDSVVLEVVGWCLFRGVVGNLGLHTCMILNGKPNSGFSTNPCCNNGVFLVLANHS